MGDVVQFRRSPAEDFNRQAAELGTPEEWLHSAIDHLEAAAACPAPDGVLVSQAALKVVLSALTTLAIGAAGVSDLMPDGAA